MTLRYLSVVYCNVSWSTWMDILDGTLIILNQSEENHQDLKNNEEHGVVFFTISGFHHI